MPKISRATAPNVTDAGPAVDRGGPVGDFSADFVTITRTHSLTPLLVGLPDDACPCPHWGYVFSGTLTVDYIDRPTETYGTGDAFYMAPGHRPAAEAGSEFLQFSPAVQLAEVMAVIGANAQRLMQG